MITTIFSIVGGLIVTGLSAVGFSVICEEIGMWGIKREILKDKIDRLEKKLEEEKDERNKSFKVLVDLINDMRKCDLEDE